jgi:hypothetical protein
MSKRDQREVLAIMEAMAVEASRNGQLGFVDVVVAGEHVARAEYTPRVDRFDIHTLQGEFSL